MRIAVLQTASGKQVVFRDQRLDDTLVRIALLAVVVHDAGSTAFGGRAETGGVLRVEAVVADRERDGRRHAARFQLTLMRGPDVKVFAAMARRCMHEARTGIVGNVIAFEQRNREIVTERRQRMGAGDGGQFFACHIANELKGQLRLGGGLIGQLLREDQLFARLRTEIVLRAFNFVEAILDPRRKRDGAVTGDGPRCGRPNDD